MNKTKPSPLQRLSSHYAQYGDCQIFVKRDDLLHPHIQGNKWRKLSPIIPEVLRNWPGGIVTFGGPFSNHLHAVSVAGRLFGFPTAGFVRGEFADLDNPTLKAAAANGMALFRLPKAQYDAVKSRGDLSWSARQFPQTYLLPEGGSTQEAMVNCAAISAEIETQLLDFEIDAPDFPVFLCAPAGTGATAAGLILGATSPQIRVLVFPVVNRGFDADFMLHLLEKTVGDADFDREKYLEKFSIITDYEFGGFAKRNPVLMDFAQRFEAETGILLDPVYTVKMFYGMFDLLEKGFFPKKSRLVLLHTGGLQGWGGFA